jgi:hypothetical protein
VHNVTSDRGRGDLAGAAGVRLVEPDAVALNPPGSPE